MPPPPLPVNRISTDEAAAAAFAQAVAALERRDHERAAASFLDAFRRDPEFHAARLGYAVCEMALGRDVLAMSAILDGVSMAPSSAELRELLGDLYDRDERVEEAVAEWREAFRLAPGDRLRDKILRGERELAAGWNDRSAASAHFTVRFDRGVDLDLTAEIVDFLEHRYRETTSALEHAPVQPIVVILYPEREFRDVTQAPDNVAGLYDGKIRVPLGGIRTLDAGSRSLLSHELTHAVVHSKTHGNCPRWLHEGLAQRFEERPSAPHERATLAEWLSRRGPPEWDSDLLSYPAALSFVRFLEEQHGWETIVSVLESLGEGQTIDSALVDAFGAGTASLTRRWFRTIVGDGDDAS